MSKSQFIGKIKKSKLINKVTHANFHQGSKAGCTGRVTIPVKLAKPDTLLIKFRVNGIKRRH